MKRCEQLADVIVSGEPMTDEQRAHLASCSDCASLAAMPRLVAATAVAPEPGPGFVARITANARERIDSRRRQRFVGFGLAAVAAAGVVLLAARYTNGGKVAPPKTDQSVAQRPAGSDGYAEDPDTAPDGDNISDDELRELVSGDSLSRVLAPTADWDDIEAPLSNYRAVLRLGGQP
jgi:hypothetical protein